MSKIVKVKLSDIENIVKMVVEQQSFDDFDTKIQPEELTPEPEIDMDDEEMRSVPPFLIGKDDNGNIGIVNTKTGEVLRKN